MTFNFSDFEDETTGSIPGGWTLEVTNVSPPRTQVISGTGVIRGEKSFRIGDVSGGGYEQVSHPVSDEDVRFNGKFENATIEGDSATVYWYSDAGWWFAAWTDSSGGSFQLYFGTGSAPSDNDITQNDLENLATTQVGSINTDTPALFEFVDVETNLKFLFDDTVVYEHGAGFTGASEFTIRTDDAEIVVDNPGEISTHIFETGDPVLIAGGPQDYVYSIGVRLVSEGDSEYTYISGDPIDT